MGFEQVQKQYADANYRQTRRAQRQHRDFYTKKEQAARAFYGAVLRLLEPAREGEKIFAEDLHAENPGMRRQKLDEFPENFGRAEQGKPA